MPISSIQDVKDKLAAAGATDIEEGTSYDYDDRTIHRIYYRPPADEKIDPRKEVVELSDDGQQIRYFKAIPGILRESPTIETQREPIYTKQEIFDSQSNLIKETILNVEDIHISASGNRDNVRVRVLDKDDMFDDLHFIAYKDGDKKELKQVKR